MNTEDWILIDTETTGIIQPIYVVEIAAQKMRGLNRHGAPFRKLINHKTEIPSEASRVHGYTKEILERDGEDPFKVYGELLEYVGDLPISAYNLTYDWDEVLLPEWERLGIPQIGQRGFCSYHLTRRLLDPSPAGNFKLQTLRQYYRLPERGAHTALGDVDTVIDLFDAVLSKRIEEEGIETLSRLATFASQTWYPRTIPFGKFKGRNFQEAESDIELKNWLLWLSESDNERTSELGKWYLEELGKPINPRTTLNKAEKISDQLNDETTLNSKVESLRSQLAELDSSIMSEKSEVDAIQARLFEFTKEYYRKRDHLVSTIKYRKRFLDILLVEGEEEASETVNEFQEAESATDKEYAEASAGKKEKSLSDEDKMELNEIWKKLARVYHPDTVVDEPKKQITYSNLSSAINKAKAEKDITLLREIAEDTGLFVMKQGWELIDTQQDQIANLSRLIKSLEKEILQRQLELETLQKSTNYEIMVFCRANPQRIEEIASQQIKALENEIFQLQHEADTLGTEITELTGESVKII